MKVHFFNTEKLEELRNKISENIKSYHKGKIDFIENGDLKISRAIKDFKKIELQISKKNQSEMDYENIKKVYLSLKHLKESQAADERLWAGLCHMPEFFEYIHERWECKNAKCRSRN